MEINRELFGEVSDAILSGHVEWDQRQWSSLLNVQGAQRLPADCGVRCCIFGAAVLLADRALWPSVRAEWHPPCDDSLWEILGARFLGLDEDTASWISGTDWSFGASDNQVADWLHGVSFWGTVPDHDAAGTPRFPDEEN